MINIPVDEGYAYDYLSILDVKIRKLGKGKRYYKQVHDLMAKQIGFDLHGRILQSQEYENCIAANLKTFDCVEKARYGEVSAKEVDDCNMERYNAKVALQKKFFNTEVVEAKS